MRNPIEVIEYKGTEKEHDHNHTQIVLPLSGSLSLEVEKRQQLVSVGQACLISTNQSHTHLAETHNHCLVLNALPVWDSKIESKFNFIEISSQAQAYLPFLSSLCNEPNQNIKTRQALTMLEHLLPIPQDSVFSSDARIEKAQRRLDIDYQEAWSLEALANDVHLSPSQLTILFKREFFMTPKQYLLARRLEEACIWLSTTNKNLDFIAHRVGFSSASQLVKVFSKHKRVTPGQYRKALPC